MLEALAVVIFHQAVKRLSDHPIDADTKINPAAIGLDPEKWEKDGLFNGEGLSLEEARARVAGVENMLLTEITQAV